MTLSKALKKRLEERGRLTPREAAALWLIYREEARAKKKPLRDYAPAVKLEERMTAGAFGEAFDSLLDTAGAAEEWGQKNLWRLMYRATKLVDAVDLLSTADVMKTVARLVLEGLLPRLPKPVTFDEWNRLVAHDQEDTLVEVEAFARHIADEELEAEGFKELPEGGWEGVKVADLEARRQKARDRLTGMIKAGELTGGLAVWPRGWAAYTLISEDDTIPGLAALRAFWPVWTRAHDLFIQETPTIDQDTPAGWREIYAPMSRLEVSEMVGAVATCLSDAKKTAWGKTLITPADLAPEGLARLVMQVETPLLLPAGDVVGRVDWKAFSRAHADFKEKPVWVVKNSDLKAKAAALGLKPDRFESLVGVMGRFYPEAEAQAARGVIGSIAEVLTTLHYTDAPPFTYGKKRPDFFGIDLVTPLEDVVLKLGLVFGEVATYKRVLRLVSEDYFGGLPLTDADTAEDLKAIEDDLAQAEETLTGWADRLKGWPWNIENTTGLILKKAAADEDEAKLKAASITIHLIGLDLGDPLEDLLKTRSGLPKYQGKA